MSAKNKMDRNYHCLYAILWPIFKILFPTQVFGHENIPEDGAVICPNHTAWNDPFYVVFSFGWRSPMRAMAKAEIMRRGIVGPALRGTFTEYIAERIVHGESVLLVRFNVTSFLPFVYRCDNDAFEACLLTEFTTRLTCFLEQFRRPSINDIRQFN